jgi:hypothetical protein
VVHVKSVKFDSVESLRITKEGAHQIGLNILQKGHNSWNQKILEHLSRKHKEEVGVFWKP